MSECLFRKQVGRGELVETIPEGKEVENLATAEGAPLKDADNFISQAAQTEEDTGTAYWTTEDMWR